MTEDTSPFRSLKAGLHVYVFLILFLCVILYTMWSVRPTVVCISPFSIVCLSAIRIMYLKMYVGGYSQDLLDFYTTNKRQ